MNDLTHAQPAIAHAAEFSGLAVKSTNIIGTRVGTARTKTWARLTKR